jgi:zinc and cadmium transporter
MPATSTLVWIALAVIVDGAVGLSGALVPEGWLARHRPQMLGFATGALVAAAAIDLIPAAFDQIGPSAFAWMGASVVVMVALETVLALSHGGRRAALPYALLGSDAIHNFGDGMAIAAAFLVSHRLGAIAALAVIIHEVPEEIADYAVLRASGLRRGRALFWLAAVQLTAGLGALVTVLGASVLGIQGPALALGAGTFLYIGLVDLLPEIVRASPDRRAALGWLGVGLVVMALAS